MLRQIAALSFGFVACVFAAEFALRGMPVATGYHYLPMDAANPVLRGTAHSPYVYSTGWNFRRARRGTLNNDGFPATYDYRNDAPARVLIIGDSFVQAAAVTPGKRMHEQLTAQIAPAEAIALSRAGGSLPDYLSMAEWGVARYEPAVVVMLIVLGDVEESVVRKPGGYSFARSGAGFELVRQDRPPASLLKRLLNESMLVRYAYDNLALHARLGGTLPKVHVDSNTARGVSEYFLDGLARHIPANKTILMFYRGRHSHSFALEADIDALLAVARARGIRVMDLGPAFTAYERSHPWRLDEAPFDLHWNELAHAYVAEQLAETLRTIPES